MQVQTVEIFDEENKTRPMIINQSDFDPKIHKRWDKHLEFEAKMRVEADFMDKIEAEVKAKIEAELRPKIEAEIRTRLESEIEAKVKDEKTRGKPAKDK